MIGALLRRPLQWLRQRIHDDLVAQGYGDLHRAHLSVLQYPGPKGRRPSELARAAGLTKQAMNHLLGQLEVLGYVARRPTGGRGVKILLTAKGARATARIRETVSQIEIEWAEALGAHEFKHLRKLLSALNGLVEAKETGALDDGNPS